MAIVTRTGINDDRRQPIIDYLQQRKLPDDVRKKIDIPRKDPRFVYFNDTLFRRSFGKVLLRCLSSTETAQAMNEAHSGVCGAHQSGAKLHFQIKRMRYYWPTMIKDYIEYPQSCQPCQFHANFIHQPPEPLHPIMVSWPFNAWGLDMVRPIPKSTEGHVYILATTDYFSKWAEIVPLLSGKKEEVADFIKSNLIYRYVVPRCIITNNGKSFDNKLIVDLCAKFKFKK
ncbi:hypothetical protein LIER_32491 [Lithospermum erythrorhizon]|uniref:Integrase catalytic domain-containing protein n=1 Tax=Lithospermum erythrorhizon TaxID=34254 RepID=A0AAV3RTY7_LITER